MFTDPQSSTPSPDEPAQTRKFMFERSFDATASARAPERKPVTLKPDQYDALKKESYDEGFAAGHKTGLDEQTERLMLLLSEIGKKIDNMVTHIHTIHKSNEINVRNLALAMAKRFVPELVARNGVQEIEAMISGVISEMVHEPRLVVRVHESQFDTLSEKINTMAAQKAYTGKVVVLVDAEVAMGDCRVEWADGGMERNTDAMMNTLESIVKP